MMSRSTFSTLRHSFDTYRFVQRLEGEGFTREAAEAVMASLGDVVNECQMNISKASVSKVEFEKVFSLI
jgi:hypothetical protein